MRRASVEALDGFADRRPTVVECEYPMAGLSTAGFHEVGLTLEPGSRRFAAKPPVDPGSPSHRASRVTGIEARDILVAEMALPPRWNLRGRGPDVDRGRCAQCE